MPRVEDMLGIETYMAQADQRWAQWCRTDPRLAAAPSRAGLRGWLAAEPAAGREVLLALAMLAAPDGADDVAAAAVLAWVMCPAAGALARRYRGSVPQVEQWIASQLWLEVRAVPWRRVRNVAASIKFALAAALRDEVIVAELPVEPTEKVLESAADTVPEEMDSDLLLAMVLQRAVEQEVITAADRDVLTDLIAHAHTHQVARNGGNGGLTSLAALTHVSAKRAVPVRTLSRRARAAMGAIGQAHRMRGLDVAV